MASMQRPVLADEDLPAPDLVRAQLARVLESPAFKATPQRRRMLTYVVEELLAGRGNEIKGYAIGVSVFGRGDDFDPNADPLVRLEARRLRHDLDSYYVSEGRDDPLRIAIPTGRYVPEIVDQQGEVEVGEGNVPAGSGTGDDARLPDRRAHWIAGAASLAFAAVASGLWLWSHWSDSGRAGLARPTIAVLPFEVLNDNKQDQFLAAGIAGQIVADLNRFPDIRIYSPQAGFAQDASAASIEPGRQPEGSYVVAGELRSGASSINVAARLLDAETGEVLWADAYERELAPENLMLMQNEIAAGIASALGQPYGVIRSEITRAIPKPGTLSQSSYECVLRGYNFRRSYSPALYPSTLACMEQAVRTDPDYAEAWAMLGFLHFISTALSILPADPAKNFRTGAEAAQRSIEIDPRNVLGSKVLSVINHYQGNYAESERYARRALEINPHDPDTLYQLGWRLAIRGRFEEGIPLLERAIDRTVNPPPPYYHLMAIDRLMKNDGKAMLDFAQRGAVDGSALSQSLVAMAYGLLGNREAATAAIERMNQITPGYDPIARFRGHQATDEIIAAMQAALRLSPS
ncbi:tetratricopeptide repeat protein [Mesorhizobium sp. ZMM04-5]|uniref:Tetratricopeptide repeat protein n=1 Tax=Mesorhizobium marinum TaxID=3228790 RepID=A0ABV3R502_9HYPH